MFLHRAQLRRVNQRLVIFLREFRRDLNLQLDFLNHSVKRVAVDTLDDFYPLRGESALAAKAEYVDSCAGADRRQE